VIFFNRLEMGAGFALGTGIKKDLYVFPDIESWFTLIRFFFVCSGDAEALNYCGAQPFFNFKVARSSSQDSYLCLSFLFHR